MRGFIASCTVAAFLLAVALAHHGHGHHSVHHDHHDDTVAVHKIAPHNIDFALAVYKSLTAKADAGKNIFFSPLGISSALAMLAKGAREETYNQLQLGQGYGKLKQAEIDEAYAHLFSMIQSSDHNQALSLGNAVAVRQGFSPLQTYQTDIERHYSGKLFDVNFSEPASAAEEINRYIENKTHNMIQDQVKDLDPATVMVLINYVYFKGEWEKPFNADMTEKEDFHVDENTTVQVDMMSRNGRYDFYYDLDNHSKVIRLPYKGNTSMMIVLPDEGKMSELEGKINQGFLRNWHDQLTRGSVDLFLPKFSINADASLDSTLKEMGITDAYGDSADFSGISTEARLKVSKVSHRAALSIDETGTVAAASTVIEIMPMSMPEVMKLNRPFMIFICEQNSRSILFMGKINNPTLM